MTLVEFLIKNGSERVIDAARDRIYKIRSLENFSFFEGSIDKGSGVREKSKQISELLGSNDMIRSEREKARTLRNKFVGISNDGRGASFGGSGSNFSSSYDAKDNYSSGRYNNDNATWSNSGSNGGNNNDSHGGGSRYSDKQPAAQEHNNHTDGGRFEEEEVKPRAVAQPAKSASGSKLKVAIKKIDSKKAAAQQAASVPQPQQEVDLFTFGPVQPAAAAPSNAVAFDAFGFSEPAPSANTTVFDPFAVQQAPPPVPQQAPPIPQATFDPFAVNHAPPVPQHAPTSFDPFSAAPVAPLQQYHAPVTPSFDPFAAQMQQQPRAMQLSVQHAPSFTPVPSFPGPMSGGPYHQQSPPLSPRLPQQLPIPVLRGAPPAHVEYGDFESHSAPAKPAPKSDLDRLVDLSSISLNDTKKPETRGSSSHAVSSGPAHNSFTGLDGFHKSNVRFISYYSI